MRVPSELIDYIHENNNFHIVTHLSPEGDALGSSIALHLALKDMGKDSTVLNGDGVPPAYRFLPFWNIVDEGIPVNIDHLILMDCNSPKRAGLESCRIGYAAVIDHHVTTNDFGDIRWVIPEAPAVGLMTYYLIQELGLSCNEAMATNLYAAIGIDTGLFRYSNTTSECIRVGSELVQLGAEPGLVAEHLYNNYTKERFLLLRETLNSIEFHNSIAVTVVTNELYERTGTSSPDTENFVNFPLLVGSVKIAAFFRPYKNGGWKVSLRSKGAFDISQVASAFGGGGHRNAAGCLMHTDLADAKKKILEKLKEIS